MKLIYQLERLMDANAEAVTLRARDLRRLIEWARKKGNKRRDKDTKRLRCAMYRAAQTMLAAADKLDAAREAK